MDTVHSTLIQDEGCASTGKWSECVHYEFSTQHAWISEFLSDSNFFMHDQSEFQCDPFQDRPAAVLHDEALKPLPPFCRMGFEASEFCRKSSLCTSWLYSRVTVSEFFSKNSY